MPQKEEMRPGRKRLLNALNKVGLNDLSEREMKKAKELWAIMLEKDLPELKKE